MHLGHGPCMTLGIGSHSGICFVFTALYHLLIHCIHSFLVINSQILAAAIEASHFKIKLSEQALPKLEKSSYSVWREEILQVLELAGVAYQAECEVLKEEDNDESLDSGSDEKDDKALRRKRRTKMHLWTPLTKFLQNLPQII